MAWDWYCKGDLEVASALVMEFLPDDDEDEEEEEVEEVEEDEGEEEEDGKEPSTSEYFSRAL
jgi:hypothetical protein